MTYGLKSGLLTVCLLALSAPALAAPSQPEPPGGHHDVNMSVQNSSPTLTTQVSANCGAASGAPNVMASDAHTAGNMGARNAATGGAVNTGVSANVDKCAKGASGMTAAPVAAPH